MEAQSAPLSRVRVFDAFRHRDFRLLWIGQAISLVGDAAFFTAIAWRGFTLVGSSRLGLVFLAQAIGLLTTLLIGGALADRLPRRSMMIASDLARLVVIGTLAGFDATGHLSFTTLLVLAFPVREHELEHDRRAVGKLGGSSEASRPLHVQIAQRE